MSRFLAAGSLQNACLSVRTRLLAAPRLRPSTASARALAQRLPSASNATLKPRFLSSSRPEPPSPPENESTDESKPLATSGAAPESEIERVVHEARQRFRDTMPAGYLTEEEYKLYVRLYGAPLRETTPEDVGIPFSEVESQPARQARQDPDDPVLLREMPEGGFEEVPYTRNEVSDEDAALDDTSAEDAEDAPFPSVTDDQKQYINAVARNQREYDALIKLQQDFEAANLRALEEAEELEEQEKEEDAAELAEEDAENEILRGEIEQAAASEETALSSAAALRQLQAAASGREEEAARDDETSESRERTHRYTQIGRFSTNPKTLLLPQSTFNEPIAQLLNRTSIRHIREAAEAALGGGGLPNSPSAPSSRKSAPQQAIGLEAAQHKMTPIEADAYIATILPPAYAATMSALVEVRKRLGTEWIQNLLTKEDGPKVLDMGAGGAGLAAWQDIIRAEWDAMRDGGKARGPCPSGKKTVVVGSDNLRHRISRFLHDTTFLPRLPDYVHSKDIAHRNLDAPEVPLPKKTYDVVIASYVLLTIPEGHRRKAMLNKLWSLLSPEGGVLVFIEKGHPRGFEAIAEVREKLIQEYLATPADPDFKPAVTEEIDPGYQRVKEPGMIVAPCTNHRTCPMYTAPGKSKGRKDFCSFQQRFYRPRFLQQILGAKHRNHDDVQFSYVAIQRGKKVDNLVVGDEATEKAFAGYEDASEAPNMFSLPRQVLAPLKRTGHIQLEVCTPSGRIERWTVPKSRGKQSYHDARKAVWGDLWALGAKTRIPRSIRLGRVDDGDEGTRVKVSKKTRTIRVESEDNVIKRASETPEARRRTKAGRLAARRSLRDDLMEGDN